MLTRMNRKNMNAILIERVLNCVAWTKYFYQLQWGVEENDKDKFYFSINCNDFFIMAADSVDITEENINLLEETVKEFPTELGAMIFVLE